MVDHQALTEALDPSQGGTLGGYGADLWSPEPPEPDDQLLGHDRVLVTPHVSALTDVTYREICMRPAEAVVAILAGQQPDPTTVFQQAKT